MRCPASGQAPSHICSERSRFPPPDAQQGLTLNRKPRSLLGPPKGQRSEKQISLHRELSAAGDRCGGCRPDQNVARDDDNDKENVEVSIKGASGGKGAHFCPPHQPRQQILVPGRATHRTFWKQADCLGCLGSSGLLQ